MARIVVGVGGGIAAYKVAALVSSLVQGKIRLPAPSETSPGRIEVQVVMSEGASHFVGPATFAALCGRSPVTNVYDSRFPLGAHIELAEGCDLLVIAPATARILGSCAHGLADDLLATLYLSCDCPVVMAPAMSDPMWRKASVQRNVQLLQEDGVRLVGPESGWLSCRKLGQGRMAEPEQILAVIAESLN